MKWVDANKRLPETSEPVLTCSYTGKGEQIKLRFRPWWSESREAQPIHNYVWQVWSSSASRPVVLFSNGTHPTKRAADWLDSSEKLASLAQPANR